MNEEPTTTKPFWGGNKTFATAAEAAAYCKQHGYRWMGGPGWLSTVDRWLSKLLPKTQKKVIEMGRTQS
jgi:hypothetical protein